MLKLLDLNIGLYWNWEERKPKIVKLISEQNPDVVMLQEVMDDAKYNAYGCNQAKELARDLGFRYYAVYLSGNMQRESPQWVGDRRCRAGNAILSRYPLHNIAKKRLKKQPSDRHHRGIVYAEVLKGRRIGIIVVHFSNDDTLSVLHMKEVLAYARKKRIRPIIVGDFNIRKTENILALTPQDYLCSFSVKKYVSFPSKGETLDYILLPREMKLKKFECLSRNVSDHRALIASIE